MPSELNRLADISRMFARRSQKSVVEKIWYRHPDG